jgi:hypothetical protein
MKINFDDLVPVYNVFIIIYVQQMLNWSARPVVKRTWSPRCARSWARTPAWSQRPSTCVSSWAQVSQPSNVTRISHNKLAIRVDFLCCYQQAKFNFFYITSTVVVFVHKAAIFRDVFLYTFVINIILWPYLYRRIMKWGQLLLRFIAYSPLKGLARPSALQGDTASILLLHARLHI